MPIGAGIADYHLDIYNRWGQRVHSSGEPWNGMFGGVVSPLGTYLYRLQITTRKGETLERHGWVELVD